MTTITSPPEQPPSATAGVDPVSEIDTDIDTGADTGADAARRIRSAVRAESRAVRARHGWLAHQNAIGVTVLAASTLTMVAMAVAYGLGAVPWFVVVVVSALAASFIHEIEHDTIHRMYFSRNKRAQDVIFAVCWLTRPYTVSPWVRRGLHLLHHEASGTETDYEERGITNGQAWGVRRLIATVDPVAAVIRRLPHEPDKRAFYVRFATKAYFPLGYLALAVWYPFVVLGVVSRFTPLTGWVATWFSVVSFLAVTWIGPNVLRVLCLHFVSSNMHYYGDVTPGNVLQQTQILDHWMFLPLQLFCCNFGSTHGIHHFVPGDPFYVRQLTARAAHRAMLAEGVRRNDLRTFVRANRYHERTLELV